MSRISVASSISTLLISLFGGLLNVVLGDVDLVSLFTILFALPIRTSDSVEVISRGATPPSPEICDVDGVVITVSASAELAPVIEPGEDCDAFPPGAAKGNCSLLFPPELDIVSWVLIAVLVSQSS